MSLDVFFRTCNLSDETEDTVSPFTGKMVQKPVGESVTPDERAAIRDLLASAGAAEPSQQGCYVPQFSDGGSAEMFFGGIEGEADFSGGMIAIGECSEELSRFMFSLAKSGNLAILPVMENAKAVVTSTETAERITSRSPDAVVVNSPDGLHAILTRGFHGG